MRFRASFDKMELFLTPAVGILNERHYYGYPVIAVAFAWLWFRCKVEIGVKRYIGYSTEITIHDEEDLR